MLDVRKPIAYLFLIIGAMLTVYAVAQPEITHLQLEGTSRQTLSFNLDMICGVIMFVFGGIMLALSRLDVRN